MSPLTRWKPRRVFCTESADHSDRPGVEHVVKFRRGTPESSAALISEVVCTQLLATAEIPVLEAHLVSVSRERAASYFSKRHEVQYTIVPGDHFGTVLRRDVENGPPLGAEALAQPQEVVDLWAFDSWFCNIDRANEGNTLLILASGARFHVIAADQSDCFGGAGRFADGSWRSRLQAATPAETFLFWQAAILDAGGVHALESAVDKACQAARTIDGALDAVPRLWWEEAAIDPRAIRDALERRVRRLPEILRIRDWEGMDDVRRQGHLFEP